MKKIAIILGILFFAQAAYAGGTILYSPSTEVIQPQVTDQSEVPVSKKGKKQKGKFRLGTQRNDPNTYWNFGTVQFGTGFSSEGSSTKRF